MIIHGATRFGLDVLWYGPRGNKVAHHLGDRPSPEERAICLNCAATVEVCDATDAGLRRGPCPWRAARLGDDSVMSEPITVRWRPLDAYKARVDELLEDSGWKLAGRQIYDLLVVDGYVGCYETVWRYIKRRNRRR